MEQLFAGAVEEQDGSGFARLPPSPLHQAHRANQSRGHTTQQGSGAPPPSSAARLQYTGGYAPPPSYSDAMANQQPPPASLGFTPQQFPTGDPRGIYEFPPAAAAAAAADPRGPKLSNMPPTDSSTPLAHEDAVQRAGGRGGGTTVRHRGSSGANFEALADELLSL